MLFRRRHKPPLRERLRELVWPRKGFSRPIRYFQKRILRLTASPHAIAAGFAAGIMVSWTPVIGVHFVMAIILSYIIAGNLIAAALGCLAAGNPVTYPFIWAITWEIGHLLLGRSTGGQKTVDLDSLFRSLDYHHLWASFLQLWDNVLAPMLVGAIPPALITGAIVYSITFYGVRGFQTRRKARLVERAKSRMATAMATRGVDSV